MKILFWICIVIGFLSFGDLVTASPVLELERAALETQASEGETTDSTIQIRATGDWDWLKLRLAGRFYPVSVVDKYSSFDTSLFFPEFYDDFSYSLGYSWDDRYKIYDTGIKFGYKLFERIKLDSAYEIEEREPARANGSLYRLDNANLGFTFSEMPWEYIFKIARAEKEYPEGPQQYTSLKYSLNQELAWQPHSNFQLQLDYKEETGEYPFAHTKDYWKEGWALKGKHSNNRKWGYDWEYSQLYWERGFSLYRVSQYVRFNIHSKLNSFVKLSFRAIYADLDYYSAQQEDYEPGVYYEPEKDLKSRTESKVGVESQFDFAPYYLEIGTLAGYYDYDSGQVDDLYRKSIYASLSRKFNRVEVVLVVAPMGNLQRRYGFYQLRIVYRP